VPGKIIWRDERFEKVSDPSQFSILPSPETVCQGINEAALSVVFKKSKAKTGKNPFNSFTYYNVQKF